MITDAAPKSRSVTGVMMNYYHVCYAELWYFAHDINMNYDSDIVAQGRLVHEEHYTRDTSKDELILEGIRIDRITPDGYIHEVKKSDRAENAHLWQLKYYLWVLKENGFGRLHGVLEFPRQRKKINVDLSDEDEIAIKRKIDEIRKIISLPQPPKVQKIRFCRKCSYRELCWS